MPIASVHRFRDAVAVYVGTGPTQYLTPKEARKLARAINTAARSCDSEAFKDSSVGTIHIELQRSETNA
jgi:hypothetical protein